MTVHLDVERLTVHQEVERMTVHWEVEKMAVHWEVERMTVHKEVAVHWEVERMTVHWGCLSTGRLERWLISGEGNHGALTVFYILNVNTHSMLKYSSDLPCRCYHLM